MPFGFANHTEHELSTLVDRLLAYCKDYSIDISYSQAELCVRHLLMVLDLNRVHNLTRITNPDEALVLHVLDSLLLSRYVQYDRDTTLLDMGTGAGFPGIPLHILTRYPTVLVDSVRKKVDAVSSIITGLGLASISVRHTRLEEFATSRQHCFSSIVARALAPLPTLIELGAPLVSAQGRMVLTKGTPDSTEFDSGAQVANMLGFSLVTCEETELPGRFGHRTLLVYERTHATQIKLPRQNGLAKKNPLHRCFT